MKIFEDKIILITGGTGSFGSTILKKLIEFNVKEIRIFSRDENKQDEMRNRLKNKKVKFYIGDVREYESISIAMKKVDFVFHAAALKQVPSCEFYPIESIKTNILGSDNVIKSALDNGVKKLICLSTDKAVYPINAMGMSKALMEKIMIAKSRLLDESETILSATRYGNVMGSRGSVIPYFIKLIKSQQEITITDPNMTRFLMSLEDSVNLVFYAFNNANQGDIFVQKAPACTINDLAIALKEIFNSNSRIKVIGTRHGEKLYESLLSREEMAQAIDLENYYKIPADNRDLNYSKYFSEGNKLDTHIEDYNSHNTKRLNVKEIKELLPRVEVLKSFFI